MHGSGWWQRIDGDHREDIRINNVPTVEIDYSSLHVSAYIKNHYNQWAP